MKTNKKSRGKGSETGILFMMGAVIVLIFATLIHENLHALIAWVLGWQSETSTSLLTGQTTAIATAANAANTPTASFWLFFMFPSLFIFAITTAITVLKPDKIILIAGTILQFLNLASVEPSIGGSDANSAVQFIISRGWSEASAYGLHYLVLAIVILVWVAVLYVSIENNSKDAKTRIKNLFS